MTIVGIDPGQTGSVCVNINGNCVYYRMPITTISQKNRKEQKELDYYNFYHILEHHEPQVIVIEEVHAMPKQGVTSMFNFGKIYGTILGVINSYSLKFDCKVIKVLPTVWKSHYGLLKAEKEAILEIVNVEEKNKQFAISKAEAKLLTKYYEDKYVSISID